MKLKVAFFLVLAMLMQMIPAQAQNPDLGENTIISGVGTSFRCGSNGRLAVADDGVVSVTGGSAGAFLECVAEFNTDGVYHVIAECVKSPDSGIVQFAVDNDKMNDGVDLYASVQGDAEVDFGYAEIDAGSHRIRFSSFKKNEKSSGYGIKIKSITFKKETLNVEMKSDKTGHIFVEDDEIPEFNVRLENKAGHDVTYKIEYRAKASHGYEKSIVTEESLTPYEIKNKTVEIPVDFKDTYILEAIISSEELNENYSVSTVFSYIEKVEELDEYAKESIFGMCTHFSQGKGDTKTNAELLTKAGVKWIRDDFTWGELEPQRGVYRIDDYHKEWINEVLNRNINILPVFTYGNVNYDGDVAPFTDDGFDGYANGAAFVAEEFKGKFHAIEIWNEYNGGFGNPAMRGPDVYAQMLKRAYIKIKEVNPDMQVLCGGAIHFSPQWFKEVFDTVGTEYMDAMSYHPYSMPDAPNAMPDKIFRSDELMWRYGTDKPQWITEVGWHIGNAQHSIDETSHAAYMIWSYIFALANDVERVFYYDLQDDFSNLDEREGNFGLIKCFENVDVPYAAKQGYVAYPAMVNKLEGATFKKLYQLNNNIPAYVFEDRNGQELVVLMNTSGTAQKIHLSGNNLKMDMYDMFGNITSIDKIAREPVYLVGEKGQFSPSEVEVSDFLKLSATVDTYTEGDFDGVGRHLKGLNIEHLQAHIYKDGKPAWSAGGENKEKELLFDMEDGYTFGKIMPADFTVTYFDEGNGSFHITYPTADGNKDTEPINLTNTGTWKTVQMYIPDGKYANNFDGNDFLVVPDNEVYLSKVTVKKKSGIENNDIETILSDVVETTNTLVAFGDNTQFSICEKDGIKGTKTHKDSVSSFIYININDDIIYDGSYDLKVYIDYFDEGKGHFSIAYPKRDGNQWQVSDVVRLTDTKKWKTACIELPAAECDNTANGGDFRIGVWDDVNGTTAEDVIFGKVRVELPQSGDKKELSPLIDISGHWAEDVITTLHENEIIAGYEDNTFAPDATIGIDEFISMLVGYLKVEVKPSGNYWAENIINKAIEMGIVRPGEFDDYTRNINRGEMALMMSRVSGGDVFKNAEMYVENIGDYSEIDIAYRDAVLGCTAMGIMLGYEDGNFHVERLATRAEAATMIARL